MGIMRKFKRRDENEKRKYAEDVRNAAVKLARVAVRGVDEQYQKDIKTYNDAAIIVTAAAAAQVLDGHWGGLVKKDTRIERFMELFVKELENFQGERGKAMEKAKKLLKDKWNVDFNCEE